MKNSQTNYYIGSRYDWSKLNTLLERSVSKLNESLTKNLRTAALAKGIKKTEQGVRLDFYSVNGNELALLQSTDARPLVKVDAGKMTLSLNEVNSKYQQRMDWSTAQKYKMDLGNAFAKCIDVIGTDTNERAKPTKVLGKNPYKVGDWIDTSNQYCYHATGITNAISKLRKELFGYSGGNISDAARVYKVSDSSYWIELPFLNEEPKGVSNWEWADVRFDNLIIANGCNNDNTWNRDHDWTIPYEGNEDAMEFVKAKTPIRFSQSDINYPKLTEYKGYRSEYTERD
jgi:hypothetical protein